MTRPPLILPGLPPGKHPIPPRPQRCPIVDSIYLEPEISGQYGRAWLINLPRLFEKFDVAEAYRGSIATWLVEAPWSHPSWHSYLVQILSLQWLKDHPMPDRPAVLIDNMTHEIGVMALTPHPGRELVVTGEGQLGRDPVKCTMLSPANFAAQFIAVDDAAAIERARADVQAICDGVLSPDSDFLHQWVERYSANCCRKPDPHWLDRGPSESTH